MDLPLWKKANSAPFLCQCFCSLEKLFFLLRMLPNTFFHQFGPKKSRLGNFKFFTKTLAKCKFCNFLILMFLKERLFLWQECRHKNWPKNVKVKKFHIFCPKPRTNVLNRCFYSLERLRLVL